VAFRSVAITRSYEQVVQQISAEISAGRLTPGQRLPTERDLSLAFGVSRGVVREAVKVLGAMGLVEPRQGSGLFVRDDPLPMVTRALTLSVAPEAKSVERLFEFRRTLEPTAARLAAVRHTADQLAAIMASVGATAASAVVADARGFGAADSAFHAAVYAASDNPYLAVTAKAVREMQQDIVAFFAGLPGSLAIAAAQHRTIADAIGAQLPDGAAAAMDAHISYTAETVSMVLRDRKKEGGNGANAAT